MFMMAAQVYPELATSVALLDLPLTSFKPLRYRPRHLSTWSGHLAFAHDLIAAIRPSLVVELGTHWGESYFTFCQSIFENALDCRSYAVDHWLGEAHSGLYGDEVFEDVRRYNHTHYGQFSYLLRSSFDDALERFSEESVDLLHIDGFHTYAAVSHDFRSWLGKVKPGGIILVHDIDVRHADFGVWRLWEEIKREFSGVFEFHHCWGLGVIRKPGGALSTPPLLDILFQGSPDVQERVRRHYFLYASHLEATLRTTAETTVQIYPFGENGYVQETSLMQPIGIGESEKLSFYLPHGLGNGPLRIDPAACPCIAAVHGITVTDAESNEVLWQADDPARLQAAVGVSGSATALLNRASGLLVSYGEDPRIILPTMAPHHGPARIEISLRLDSSYGAIYEALQMQARDSVQAGEQEARDQIQRMEHELSACKTTADQLSAELRQSQGERMLITFEMKQAVFDRHAAEREMKQVEAAAARRNIAVQGSENGSGRAELETANAELQAKHRELESASRELESASQQLESARRNAQVASRRLVDLEAEVTTLNNALREESALRSGMLQSVSWRVTEPARRFMSALRSAGHRQ